MGKNKFFQKSGLGLFSDYGTLIPLAILKKCNKPIRRKIDYYKTKERTNKWISWNS